MFSWQTSYLNGFSWQKNLGAKLQQLNKHGPVWVEAGILACNAWLVFEGEYQESVRRWAGYVLQCGNPVLTPSPQATFEAMVGYPLHKRYVRAEMYKLLQFVLKREDRRKEEYHIQFIPVQFEASLTEVWCLTAVRPAHIEPLKQ